MKEEIVQHANATAKALAVFTQESGHVNLKLQALLVKLRDEINEILETNEGVELFDVVKFMKLVSTIVEADLDVDRLMQSRAHAAQLDCFYKNLLKETP